MDLIIQSERLTLMPIQLSDAADVFEYASDPAVSRFTSWPVHQSVQDTEAFLHHVLSRHQETPNHIHIVFAIRLHMNNQVIGTISISQIDSFSAHLDYALSQKYWRQGMITEVVQRLIEWTFSEIHTLTEIHSGCLSTNIGSVKVLEKSGFSLHKTYSSERGGKFHNNVLTTHEYILYR